MLFSDRVDEANGAAKQRTRKGPKESLMKKRRHDLSVDLSRVPIPVLTPQEDYWSSDPRTPGLLLRVYRSGKMTWALRYNANGKKNFFKLGRANVMTYRKAHDQALRQLGKIANDADPAGERNARRDAESFAALVDEYLKRHAVHKRSSLEDQRVINKDLLPAWKDRKADEITKRDVNKVLDAIVDRGSPVQANRVRVLIHTVFKVGIEREILKENPCAGTKAQPGGPEAPRERVLSDAEIKAVWAACEAEPLGDAARLAILTGQREMEVIQLTWPELSLAEGEWSLPAARSKNKRPHSIPLVGKALAILRGIFEAGEHDPVRVFPNAGKAEAATLMRRLRRATATDWRFHDLRRTFASGIMKLDPSLETIISRLLNHARTGVTATVYAHYAFDKEKRAALIRWDRHVDSVINGRAEESNVIELRA
jgi:integrase